MESNSVIKCGGFYFIHNFDSGNLGHVERVPTELIAPSVNHKTGALETPDYEFNLWTKPDCAGTEFENGNRSWFYFGIQASEPSMLVRLNLINLNKQGKMYNQGMAPVTRTLPGKPQWERIKDRPVHSLLPNTSYVHGAHHQSLSSMDDTMFTLSFKYRTSENLKATTFFAFTYPYSFVELQIALNSIDLKMFPLASPQSLDDIYYCRECLIYSLEGRRVDLLTISSYHGITNAREDRLKNLFPENQERPFKFHNKKVIFMSARVHPGETPSSFVFNGFLNLLLSRHDPVAIQLRKLYVFKLIPFLNPDGVARGHYRTDTRGVNLNRVYLNPSLVHHPTVYASRALIRYYHFGCEVDDNGDDNKSCTIEPGPEVIEPKKKKAASVKGNPSNKIDDKKPLTSTKSLSINKSTNTLMLPSSEELSDSSGIGGEAANLINQVCDLKLQDMTSQTECGWDDDQLATPGDNTSLTSDATLRSCLSTLANVSTSEELNLQGVNPLRSLRETLKNSINLLLDTSSTGAGESKPRSRDEWCPTCRPAVESLEHGIERTLPAYHTMHESDSSGLETGNKVYSCKNCFKRYVPTDKSEENVRDEDVGYVSLPLSALAEGGDVPPPTARGYLLGSTSESTNALKDDKCKSKPLKKKPQPSTTRENESGLYLYIDLHGHASKKGIFMYGNYFEDVENSVECMLLPRIMALNNVHFHFSSCNFTERNMYLKDRRDGMSREGSGRVAVLKATGLVRSYTLECNYNTGRLVNVLPPTVREHAAGHVPHAATPAPPKYTPHIYEEIRHLRPKCNLELFEEIDPKQVGHSLGASILDLTGEHPNSRVPCSEHRTLATMREWLRAHLRTTLHTMRTAQLMTSRLRPKTASPTRPPYARSKGKATDERKENTYVGAKSDSDRRTVAYPAALGPRPSHEPNSSARYGKRAEPAKAPTRRPALPAPPAVPQPTVLTVDDSKPKSTVSKRRSVLAVRKPNSSKSRLEALARPRHPPPPRPARAADAGDTPRPPLLTKVSKRSFSRPLRRDASSRHTLVATVADDAVAGSAGWEDVGVGAAPASIADAPTPTPVKRRSFPNPSPARLKKIRLKSGL